MVYFVEGANILNCTKSHCEIVHIDFACVLFIYTVYI